MGGVTDFVGDAISSVVGGITGSNDQVRGAQRAADAQVQAAQLGIDEQRRQFDAIQALLKPFVTAGTTALAQQGNLAGLNGAGAQESAIDALQSSPQFQALLQAGNDNILANASATGGLRGGNVQGALAQFRPALLAQTINDQFSRLGGLSSLGQNSAALTGNAGMGSANSISTLLGQQGAAQAGGLLASGSRNSLAFGNLMGIGKLFADAGGMSGIKGLF